MFEYFKSRVAQFIILVLLDFNTLFTVKTDASNLGIGVVLDQEGRSIAFSSIYLNEDKKNYSTYDLELYAMVYALEKCRHYLLCK